MAERNLRFIIDKAENGEFYFIIKAPNGETIGSSLGETYPDHRDCLHAIHLIKEGAKEATIIPYDDNSLEINFKEEGKG